MKGVSTVDSDELRAVLRRQASTVTVITAAGSPPVGFTATSFTSVSLRPPLVLFCLNLESSSWPVFAVADHVAVHMLSRDQHALARRFAASGVDRFAPPTVWTRGPRGVPILDGVAACLLCEVVECRPAGDHAVVLARPVLGDMDPTNPEPLLYHDGGYRGLANSA
jgi:flavin reductase (DIM6/NTAB) family NADH-FMN oxidoreductase RutF